MASQATRDHEQIMEWARGHGACPSIVSRTGGMLRFEFDPQRASELQEVDWDDFFKVFDDKGLELLYDDKPGSRFHKFVYPETLQAKAEGRRKARPARAGKRLQIANAEGRRSVSASAGRSRSSRSVATRGRASSGSKSMSGRKATATRTANAPKRSAVAKAGNRRTAAGGASVTRHSKRSAASGGARRQPQSVRPGSSRGTRTGTNTL